MHPLGKERVVGLVPWRRRGKALTPGPERPPQVAFAVAKPDTADESIVPK